MVGSLTPVQSYALLQAILIVTGFSYALLVLKNNENCTYWHCPWIWLFTILGILKYVCSLLNRNCFMNLWIECMCYTQSPEKWWPPYFVEFALFLKPSLLLSCAPPGHLLGQSPCKEWRSAFSLLLIWLLLPWEVWTITRAWKTCKNSLATTPIQFAVWVC